MMIKRSVANWMVEKQRCTEKEKRLRNLLVINSGLKIEGGRWLDRRFDLENLDTEVLLVKVLKTLTDDRNKLMSLNETEINAEDTNQFGYGKNVSSELKRLFMKKPKFTNTDSVREFILQMARTIIACNPNASVLSPDFTLLATNYGLSQDTANLQTQIYELKTENERITTDNTRLKQDNDSLTSGYQSLQVAYQDLLDNSEGGNNCDKLTQNISVLRDELQTVQNERDNVKQQLNTLLNKHEMDMEKLKRDLQIANTKSLQRLEEETNKQKEKIRKDLNDEREKLITQYDLKLSVLKNNNEVEKLRKTFRVREEKLMNNVDKLRLERNELDEKLKNVEMQNTAAIARLLHENAVINNELTQSKIQINEQSLVNNEYNNEELENLRKSLNESNNKVLILNDELNKLKTNMVNNSEETTTTTNYIYKVLIEIATTLGVYNSSNDENITTIGQLVLNEISTLAKIFEFVRVSRMSYTQPSLSTSNVDMLSVWVRRLNTLMKEHEETEKVFEEQLAECENNLQKNKQTFLVDMQRLQDDLRTNFQYELQHITENNKLYPGVLNILTIINSLPTQTPYTVTSNNVINETDINNAVQNLNYLLNYSHFLENLINMLRKYIDNDDDLYTIMAYNARKQIKFIDDIEQLFIVHSNLDWDYEFNLNTNTDNIIDTNNDAVIALNKTVEVETTTTTNTPNNTTTNNTTTVSTYTTSNPIISQTVSNKKRRIPLITLSSTPSITRGGDIVKTTSRIQKLPITESFSTSINKIAKRISQQYVPKEASTSEHERIDKMEQFDIDKYVNVKKRKNEYDQLREKTSKTNATNVIIEGFEIGAQSVDEDEEIQPSDLEFVDDEDVELTRDVVESRKKHKPVTNKVSRRFLRQIKKLRKSRDIANTRHRIKGKKKHDRQIIYTSTDEEEIEENEQSIVNTAI
ncbi:hypothetical protein [Psilogramma increta granulovirus]|uniref:Uncharacterized protein n=1 Tax=Psilogramma increta granulovirus TaxID=2953508 RepID=A0A977TNV1_9BBAC|nr:hypothetical protein [Psilogramma increta granulovirus]